ncbi:hypothetical protein BSKO_00118 [Bryopsis sp. KO-2023]|nr:hypothetical protein BSKO_00118 [Bryopsis sp. KO-2023]
MVHGETDKELANKKQQVLERLGYLDDRSEKFANEACIDRYLRARDGNVEKAAEMLRESIKWRREFGIDALDPAKFPADIEGGKFYICQAENGQPVMIMRKRSSRLERHEEEGYVEFMCNTLESATRLMPEGIETWVWIMDLKGYSSRNSPRVQVTLNVLKILANHFPERMGKCYIVDAPSIFSLLWSAVHLFVDPVTKEKINFIYSSDYDENGLRKDGKSDTSNFGKYISFLRSPYHSEKYKKILNQVHH